MRLRQFIFGSALPTAEQAHQRLTKVKALAVFSSDALSSVAYATEEILLVLVIASTAVLQLSMPIALTITGLLVIVAVSYYQTIHGYPSGGGAYIVAHENLGVWPGLIAAAALLIDYVLTVAVSITAGVTAITSAFPAFLPLRTPCCLVAIALITWANLRGVRESGTLFAIPTYGFMVLFLGLITVGMARLFTGTLSAAPAMTDTTTLRLIPLYSVGVFLSFTLSQAGMVRHWQKSRKGRWRWKAVVNGVGVVVLPEIVPAHWWQHFLHNQTTLMLKAVLLFRQDHHGEARVVINVPYHLRV